MFKTKICGITNQTDAEWIGETGVEAIGLNFFKSSKRYVAPATAANIQASLPVDVKRVGVFVNASVDSIYVIADQVGLDYIQLHGDEPATFVDELADLTVIRAFRCKTGLQPLEHYLGQCRHPPAAVLIDAFDPKEFGGTGKVLHWPDLVDAEKYIGDLPLILAGGLVPTNVAEAIRQARPAGVDTASGVETGPGEKNRELACQFVHAANHAFSAMQAGGS